MSNWRALNDEIGLGWDRVDLAARNALFPEIIRYRARGLKGWFYYSTQLPLDTEFPLWGYVFGPFYSNTPFPHGTDFLPDH